MSNFESAVTGGDVFFEYREQQLESAAAERRKGVDDPKAGAKTILGTIKAYSVLSLRYTAADIISRPRNTCIGVLSVFLVVFFTGLVLTAISKTPYVLLRFAEVQAGEMDSIVLADGAIPFINYSSYGPVINAAPQISGSAPRWLAKGQIVSWADERENLKLNVSQRRVLPNVSTNILVIDSALEKTVGIGRAWPYREIGFAEVQVYHSALRYIGVKPNVGERLRMFIDIQGLLDQQGVNLNTTLANIANPVAGINTTANGTFTVGNTTFSTNAILAALEGITVAGVNGTTTNLLSALNQSFTTAINPIDLVPSSLKLTVADSVVDIQGKYPALLGNMAVLDYRQFVEMVNDQNCFQQSGLNTPLTLTGQSDGAAFTVPQGAGSVNPIGTLINGIKMEEYALLIVAMFNNRFDIYYQESKQRARSLIRTTNALFLAIGLDFPGKVQYPLATTLNGFDFLQLFLDSVFTAVVAVIIVLGAILVHMLLVTNADERQFEVAMIRAQGMARSQLLHLMMTQTFAFLFPGLILGVGFLFAVNAIVEDLLSGFTEAPPRPDRIPGGVVAFAVVIGVVMPIIANYRPIRAALSTSLRDALDVYRQKTAETQVTVQRLEELGLAPWQTMLGLFLSVAGFVVYYLVPLSFIFNNLYMFFLLLNFILLTMIFGLCLLSFSAQGVLQKGVLRLLLWGRDRRLWTLITRNMQSHKDRNMHTFMMFNISVACIVFGGVLFTLLATSLTQTVMIFNGADVSLTSLSNDYPLNRKAVDEFLRTQPDIVDSWSFATFPLRDASQSAKSERVSSIVNSQQRTIRVVAVDENFQRAVYDKFVLYTETDGQFSYSTTRGRDDVVKSMYTNPTQSGLSATGVAYTGYPRNYSVPDVAAKFTNVVPCIMASSSKDVIGLTAGTSGILTHSYYINNRRSTVNSLFLLQPRALARRLAGFGGISSQRFGFSAGAVVIPLDAYRYLLRANDTDFAEEPTEATRLPTGYDWVEEYQKCFIRLRAGLSKEQRTDFVNFLQSRVNPYYHLPLDTLDIIDNISFASQLIIYFFFFVSAVAVILDAIMLWLAFVSNVRSNAWSFGVLRSLGFTTAMLTRAFVYESLCIVLSSFFVGTITGILVAVTLTLQMNLFLDLPFEFNFPTGLYFFLLGLSLIAAVVGSIVPTRSIAKIQIAQILKKAD